MSRTTRNNVCLASAQASRQWVDVFLDVETKTICKLRCHSVEGRTTVDKSGDSLSVDKAGMLHITVQKVGLTTSRLVCTHGLNRTGVDGWTVYRRMVIDDSGVLGGEPDSRVYQSFVAALFLLGRVVLDATCIADGYKIGLLWHGSSGGIVRLTPDESLSWLWLLAG